LPRKVGRHQSDTDSVGSAAMDVAWSAHSVRGVSQKTTTFRVGRLTEVANRQTFDMLHGCKRQRMSGREPQTSGLVFSCLALATVFYRRTGQRSTPTLKFRWIRPLAVVVGGQTVRSRSRFNEHRFTLDVKAVRTKSGDHATDWSNCQDCICETNKKFWQMLHDPNHGSGAGTGGTLANVRESGRTIAVLHDRNALRTVHWRR